MLLRARRLRDFIALLAAGAVVTVMMDLAGSLLLLKILLDVGVVLLRGRDVAVL